MQPSSKNKFLIRLSRPSKTMCPWLNSLPSGNGKTGILLQGGVRNERIMITSSNSLWQGQVGVLPDISDKIKNVRKNMASKNPTLASSILSESLLKKGYNPVSPALLPVCDLKVTHNVGTKPISAYVRELDMESGEIKVAFNYSGNKCERTVFVSKAKNLVVYQILKLSGSKNLSVELSLVQHDKSTSCFEEGIVEPFKLTSEEYQSGFITFAFDSGLVSGGAVARVIVDQKAVLSPSKNLLRIDNAEKIIVLISTFNGKKEKTVTELKTSLEQLKNINYEKLLFEHKKLFSKEWGKTELSISNEKDAPADSLLDNFDAVKSKLLYEKLFHYARYLTICGLDSDYAALCPSALWSFHYNNTKSIADISDSVPAFASAALRLGLEHKMAVIFDYFEEYASDLRKNASRIYKAKGFMVPKKVAYKTGLAASVVPSDLSFVAGGAILANLFFDYFEYTRDLKFLKTRAIPFMKEIAAFYLSYFQVDEKGELRSCPSYSPSGVNRAFEHRPLGIYENCACDFLTVRTLITNILKAYNKYGVDLPEAASYHAFLAALPSIKISGGAVAEYSGGENSLMSGGTLHLYPVFASNEVSGRSSDSLISAFLSVVLSKITSGLFYQDATALGRLAEVAAQLGQGDAALEIINYLISSFITENLIFQNSDITNLGAAVSGDAYFNISVNQLIATAISSMLVSSDDHTISILPAIPSGWNKGEIHEISTRCGAVVDLSWDFGKGYVIVKIRAVKSTEFNLVLPKNAKKVKNIEFDSLSSVIENIVLTGGKTTLFEIKL